MTHLPHVSVTCRATGASGATVGRQYHRHGARLQSERFKETIEVYAERRLVVLQRLLRLYDFELFYDQ